MTSMVLVKVVASFLLRGWYESCNSRRGNFFSRRNADYFDYIDWTWNLYQRPPCGEYGTQSLEKN